MSEEMDALPSLWTGPGSTPLDRDDPLMQRLPADQPGPSADRQLLEQIRGGDLDAGHRFVQDYYPGVYRYLLYLTGSPDAAED